MSENSKQSHGLSTTQAGIKAGKHKRTIVAWIRSGKLAAKKLPGGRGAYIIDPDVLEATLKFMSTPIPYTPEEKK